MPEIRPFRALLYRRITEPGLESVLAPPYDVISQAYAETLAARHPHNVVRLILNRDGSESGYVNVGELYRRWIQEGVFVADTERALYLLEQRFALDEGTHTRRGLLARFRAEDPETGAIRPHERTRSAACEDRYRMLRQTRANFGPIFQMFPDPEGVFGRVTDGVFSSSPLARFEDDGRVEHRLWRVTDDLCIASLQSILASVPAYIADGHHRHATALRYRDEVGPDGAWSLGYFTPLGAPGLVALPYHRILHRGPSFADTCAALEVCCELSPVADLDQAARTVARSRAAYAFALAGAAGRGAVAESRAGAERLVPDDAPRCLRALDVYFLHRVVLPRLPGAAEESIDYAHSLEDVAAVVRDDPQSLAFLMRATPVAQIVAVADAGESMPPKSTFFHPKLPSGLVVHPLVTSES